VTDPTALIVGASRGLGHAMAAEFVKRGWHVIGTVRGGKRTALHDLADAHPGQIDIETLDITAREQIAALRNRLSGRAIDMLFVNAGIATEEPFARIETVTPDEFSHVMLTNAYAPMRVIAALQDRVPADGLIGAMSSGQGSIANNTTGNNDAYRASKVALNMLMQSFAARDGDTRSFALIAPGWIKTDLGGDKAPYTVEDTVPLVVDVLLAKRSRPGLEFLDRFGKIVPW
jgi:NAD(P)-dependent dehydrogenase (short-subunit alcohol dehydrogenase family)